MARLISLGRDCQAASQIDRVTGAGRPSQFFDWLVTPHDGLISLLGDDFQGFLSPGNISDRGEHDGFHYAVDSKFGIELIHEFPISQSIESKLPSVRAKFAHLADRFRALADQSDLVFVRQVEPVFFREDHARLLYEALSNRFDRSFRLLFVSDVFTAPNWSIPGVTAWCVRQPKPYVWTGSNAAWDDAFRALGTRTG
jgi:hypothetical protein